MFSFQHLKNITDKEIEMSKKKRFAGKIIFGVVAILLVLGGIFWFLQRDGKKVAGNPAVKTPSIPGVWKILIPEDPKTKVHKKVEFYKNGKRMYSLQFARPYRISFMVPLENTTPYGGSWRFMSKNIEKTKEFRYQDHLVDLQGKGEKRFLIVHNWTGGNAGFEDGHLIDTMDDFAILGRIPTGEIYDYTYPNPELVFEQHDEIDYFGVSGRAAITVRMKLQKGKAPRILPSSAKKFSLQRYKDRLENETNPEVVLAMLYCDLASAGLLKSFPEYARKLGLSQKAIQKTKDKYRNLIRKSRLYPHIYKLNGKRL